MILRVRIIKSQANHEIQREIKDNPVRVFWLVRVASSLLAFDESNKI